MIIDDYYTLVQALSGGREVIIGFDNGPRPEKPYAAIFLNVARPSTANYGPVDDTGVRYVQAHRPARLQVHCFGDNSEGEALAELIAMGFMTDACIDSAAALNISWMSQPTVESIPALMDNGDYEDRAILTIETAYTGSLAENVSFIETVEVTVETEPAVTGPTTILITVD